MCGFASSVYVDTRSDGKQKLGTARMGGASLPEATRPRCVALNQGRTRWTELGGSPPP